jgi:hypothetical protein
MKKALLLFSALGITSFASAQFSIQHAVIEEFTGAWCGYCPDGALIVEDIIATNDRAIAVGIHNSDAMTTADGDEVDGFFNSLGYPGATINRNGGAISRNLWESNVTTTTGGSGYVTIGLDSLNFNVSTREVTLSANAFFTGPVTGDMRFVVWVTEDNINQTGTGYNQTNYYNTTSGHPYYGAGDPIVGFNHRHVLRLMPEGAWGVAGIIPTSVNYGTSVDRSFSFTLPGSVDENEVHIVVGVAKFDGSGLTQRRILNADESLLLAPVSVDPAAEAANANMVAYPNPFSTRTSVQFHVNDNTNARIEVVNTLGQHIATLGEGYLAEGTHTLNWSGHDDNGTPVANGVYLVRLTTDAGQSGVVRVMMQR